MLSKRNSGLIDLRQGRSRKSPSARQIPLFSARPPREPEPPRRPMPLRARRRRVRALIALGVLVLCGALFWGVSYVSYLPQFNISPISVMGANGISEERIRRRVETVLDDGSYHILSRRNVLLYPRAKIEEQIVQSFPPIKSVHVARTSLLSNNLVVTVEERRAFAQWCSPEQADCYFMDDGGFIYAPAGDSVPHATYATPYLFSGGLPSQADSASSTSPVGQTFVRAHLPGLLSLLKFLGQASFTPIQIKVEAEQDIRIELQEGFILKASFGADAGTLIKNLELVLSSDVLKDAKDRLEYIDLRFGNRVYYKLKGQEQQGAQ